MARIEKTILSNLVNSEEYCRKVVPFLKTDYFSDHFENVIAEELLSFFTAYNKPASLDVLAIQLSNRKDLRGDQTKQVEDYINELTTKTDNQEWLFSETEKFCKRRAVEIALIESIEIMQGRDKARTADAIPTLLSDALAVSFDKSVGHDYFDDYQARYDFYHRVEEKVEFDLALFNKITKGGLSKKTLNVCLAGCVHPDTLVKIRLRKRDQA